MVTRCLQQRVLDPNAISELLWMTRSLAVVGYRPGVRSLTLFDVLRGEARLLPALVRCRQLVWEAVEAVFDLPCQLFVEHTALICWGPGASIGWHHDRNRPYLEQRHYSAVLYLSNAGEDFRGGTFAFQAGPPPLRIQPADGLLLAYSADDVHSVEPVLSGQRITLSMWLTRDQAHSEDAKILAQLAAGSCVSTGLPLSMYIGCGAAPAADIRLAALAQLGVQLVQQRQPGAAAEQACSSSCGDSEQADAGPHACVVVPAASCGNTGSAESACCMFGSMQEAMLAVHMLAWKLCPHSRTVAADGALCEGNSSSSCSCGCFSDQQLLARARAMVEEHLAAAGAQLDKLLPSWHALGAMILPQV